MSAVAAPPPPRPAASEPVPAPRRKRWLRDLLEIAGIALVLYILIWNVFETVRVDGSSMVNTLGDQDLLLASKISFGLHTPQRGDIVIVIPPTDPNQDFIKRVVGLPGDQMMIDSTSGSPKIQIKPGGGGPWQVLNEPYLHEAWDPANGGFCCTPDGHASNDAAPHAVTIPADDYFVMGDNRNHSTDSRYFGYIARKAVVAKAFLRIWPFFHFGLGPASTLIPALFFALPPTWLLRKRRRGRKGKQRSNSL